MNRKQIVMKHNPIIKQIEPLSPLSIGNGEFGFSVDITGLQTFPEKYETPLGTQSNWGWHYSHGKDLYKDDDIEYQLFRYEKRDIPYPMKPAGKEEAYHWLRQNPHRLQLGQISFQFLDDRGNTLGVDAITEVQQELDLWTGIITSHYKVQGRDVTVETACDATTDTIAVKLQSDLLLAGKVRIVQSFPNPDISHTSWSKAVHLNWKESDRHQTYELNKAGLLKRVMDEDQYFVQWHFDNGEFSCLEANQYQLTPSTSGAEFEFTVTHSPEQPRNKRIVSKVMEASEQYWKDYWSNGAFVSFAGSTDERADELERRIILSQYVTAIHSSGSLPPQETGFMYNSWFGKPHLEMHWWHGAHFPLWGRASQLKKSLYWYIDILPNAKKIAKEQGFKGVRWPKMIGVDGKQSPSPVAPGLIWQQPHPIMLAELLYRDQKDVALLQEFKEVVMASADFMADFAKWDEEEEVYVLGPPLIPAQECHRMEDSKNPPYEVEYWKYGLETAVKWAERLGIVPNQKWIEVAKQLKRPRIKDGVYLAHEDCENSFTEKNHDHPSMVAAFGILPGSLINKEIMKNTLEKVRDEWQWDTAWGWDFPMCAMTAARLEEPDLAIDFLLLDAVKNTYLPNGHNYQRPGLYAYLPGNGSLLTAIAMMIAGWDGGNKADYPGFPKNDKWRMEAEGFQRYI